MTQEFIVSTLEDENDGDFSEGDLSLREAIALANEQDGADTITFDSSLSGGTITLVKDQPTGRPVLANAPLSITDSVTISGLGADNITIDGDNGGNGIFNIGQEDSDINFTVEDITLANGAQTAFFFPGLSDPGGTFFVDENANLTLQGSVITGSSASIGGAISNYGTVNIIDSTIQDSTSGSDGPTSRPFGRRGVINNDGEMYILDSNISDNNDGGISNLGTLEIDNSNISNNSVSTSSRNYAGGGIDNLGTATITNSNITGNTASIGSGINNREGGTLTVDRSTIDRNSSTSSDNSVIFTQGTTNIIDSSVSDNDGGSNVGIVVESGTTNIEGSTVANNNAPDIGVSGVIVRTDGTANITNSTIANNNSRANAGISNSGTVNVTNSTIANNNGGMGDGGINNFNDGVTTVTSSIVADNTGFGDGRPVGDINGEFISGGNNLIGNGDDTSGFADSDLVGTLDEPIDPQLGELQDNGGATETIALLDGSPAIDAGSNPNNLAFDQRGVGFDRTVGNGTDIGAYEVQDDGQPEDLVVSTLDDENDGDKSEGDLSLREAIALASVTEGEDTISFDSSLEGGTISLTLGELAVETNLTIDGLGAENIIVDAGGNSRVFNIDDQNSDTQLEVELNDLTIMGGVFPSGGSNNEAGGGILSNENLEINNAIITGNSNVGRGAGIYSGGMLTVNNSAIVNNSADGAGAGDSGGGIFNAGTAIINQSTISNNVATGRGASGGGIENTGTLTVNNSTISGNTSGIGNNGEATITSTIVAGNGGNNDIQNNDVLSGGNNFIGGRTQSFDDGRPSGLANVEDSDIVGTRENPIDPQLGELQNNGGATPTQALLDGSPAIDAGSNPNNLETDQRGVGFDRTVGNGTDIGAYEVQDDGQPEDLVVSTLDDENDGDKSEGDLSLREAIALASVTEGEDTISFDSSLSGGTITFNQSLNRELTISGGVIINGLGQDNLTLDGGFIFKLAESDADLTIDGLNLVGGKIDSFGDLTLTDSTISQTIPIGGSSDNSSIISRGTLNISDSSIVDSDGGGDIGVLIESGTANIEGSTIANHEGVLNGSGLLILTDETVNVTNSTIANNRNRFAGGVANAGGGTVNITNSTIANNNGGLGSGGIQNSFGTVILTSSLLANNTGGGFIGDISGDGEFISGGNNLISNGDDAEGFVDGVNGDIVGSNGDDPGNIQSDLLIDARLGELQDNGGATPTITLLDGSPAIDAGSNPNNLETDQRGEGFNRTVGNGTDIGAYEVQDPVSPDDRDVFTGTNGDDFFSGGSGDDLIFGLDGHDSLHGNNGNDTISGGSGDDRITGNNGNDLLNGEEGNDTISGDRGKDNLLGGQGNDSLVGGRGDDVLNGGSGHDTLAGGKANDILNGEKGNDFLDGGAGDDLIIGGEGTDTLSGGHGHDTFVLEPGGYQDVITDFADGSDRLELSSGLTFDNLTIINNESNTGVFILNAANHDFLIATIENVHADDLTSHDFTNA